MKLRICFGLVGATIYVHSFESHFIYNGTVMLCGERSEGAGRSDSVFSHQHNVRSLVMYRLYIQIDQFMLRLD